MIFSFFAPFAHSVSINFLKPFSGFNGCFRTQLFAPNFPFREFSSGQKSPLFEYVFFFPPRQVPVSPCLLSGLSLPPPRRRIRCRCHIDQTLLIPLLKQFLLLLLPGLPHVSGCSSSSSSSSPYQQNPFPGRPRSFQISPQDGMRARGGVLLDQEHLSRWLPHHRGEQEGRGTAPRTRQVRQ